MKRITTIVVGLALAVAVMAVRAVPQARGDGSPPQSNAFGKSLTEWIQLFETWLIGGTTPDHVGHVRFLPLPVGEYAGGSFTYADPGVLIGQLDVTLGPGTP